MIPLYPPTSTAHAFHTPKWRSLVQLVSRSNSTVDLRTLADQPRTRSLSAVVFLSPSTRKASTGSLNGAQSSAGLRRPSAPSLTDLRRFLPSILQRSRSSTNVDLTTGKGGNEAASQQRPDCASGGGAKSRVKRAKANREPSAPQSSAAHRPFFQKQGRPTRKQSTPPTHGPTAVIGELENSSGNAQQQSHENPTTQSAANQPDETAESTTPLVDDNESNSSSTKGSLFIDTRTAPRRKLGSFPPTNLLSSRHCRELFANCAKGGQKEVCGYYFVDPRVSSKAIATVGQNRKPKTLHRKTHSVHLTNSPCTFFLSSSTASFNDDPQPTSRSSSNNQTSSLKRLKHAKTAFNFTNQSKQLLTAALAQRYKRHSFPSTEFAASALRPLASTAIRCVFDVQSSAAYIRRHTLPPDMTVAAYGMVICGTDELQHKYRGRIEKVKFGVPISEAFSHDIPATLLVLLLKVNKEGPLKKDIWRAPGNQAQVRKLSHIMQHGRLVNISHISVYTAASVIKKFLSKLPGGIFGPENEQQLFQIMQNPDSEQQRQVFCRVICSLSVPSQHLLVLLFGTFRIISDSAETFNTRMGPDAIGISVAPSLFHTCIHDQRAKLEDVMRFKLASQVISKIIQGFGYTNLFPRECYEFYARITGRTLRVDEHWHFTFQYPSNAFSKPTVTTFSTMMSTITAAMAARSYSLDTLGAAGPVTPPQLRSTTSCIQRGGSLKFNTPTRQPLTSCANIAGPSTSGIKNPRSNFSTTDAVPPPLPLHQKPSLHQPYHRQVSGTWENTVAGTSSASTSALQRRSSRPQAIIGQAELLYAKRVLVSADSPPHYPPPAPPTTHRTTIAARLTDLELHESNRTFSQPSICFATGEREEGTAGPSGFQSQVPASRSTAGAGSSVSTGAIERRRSSHADVAVTGSDDEEEQDVYSEALPGPLRTQARRPRGRASSSGMASGSALSGSGYSDLLAEQNRLSTSMGEVLIREGRETTSESTRSLSYLEWVHEKQTRRMVSRSEWFLSPNKGASRSFDFHHEFDMKTRVSTSSPSPSPVRHLQLPTDDSEMRSSSEEMRSQSCASSQSHASSAKEQRPDSQLPPLTIVKPLVATTTTGETTPRLPFQLLQHHSGESDDAPLSATPPARSQQAPVFFPDDPTEPPAKTSKSSSSSSGNGNGSQSSVLVAPSGQTTASNTTTAAGLTRVSSIGVVRRKSFRSHYVRPNKSLDQEPTLKEVISGTSSSTPIRGSASASSTRRGSANGGGTVPSAEASRALIRRKSSGSSAQTKIPVQARRSTQI